jgi:hypothetical protein
MLCQRKGRRSVQNVGKLITNIVPKLKLNLYEGNIEK